VSTDFYNLTEVLMCTGKWVIIKESAHGHLRLVKLINDKKPIDLSESKAIVYTSQNNHFSLNNTP
jgi:hypothetical protein